MADERQGTDKPRRGRVPLYTGGRLHVSFAQAEWTTICELAEDMGLPLAELCRRMIQDALPRFRDRARKARKRKE